MHMAILKGPLVQKEWVEVILEIEHPRYIKGHFFLIKNYKRAPLILATPLSIVYLHCF